MRTRTFRTLAGLVAAATLVMAQKPKSKGEVEAIMAVQGAQTPDAQVAAVDNLVTKFADTEFKAWALQQAANAEQRKGDTAKAIVYAERTIEADPKAFYAIQAMLLISGELARTTREFDLDKEEKLARAEKLAKDAVAGVNTAPKPNPQMTDDQWTAVKKDETAEAHKDLGLAAMARKKFDVAIAEFKQAVEGAATPDPADIVRLASAYDQAGQPDAAIPLLDKVIGMSDANPTVKKFAEGEKKRAEDIKNGKK
jgi:tetratricopeptide (TPR) repeat protein